MIPGDGDERGDPAPREPADPSEGFLSRWSRRKRQAAEPLPPPEPPVDASPAPAAAAEDERPRDPETGEPIDEELVRTLPSIEDIRPGDDISAFMRRGVPEAMRRQALRALWTTDPAIRDFVSPALDYAYDYNTPGAAPGYGPLSEADIADARKFLDRLFSRTVESAQKPPETPAGADAGQPDGGPEGSRDIESQNMPSGARSAQARNDVALQRRQESDEASMSSASSVRLGVASEIRDYPDLDDVRRNNDEDPGPSADLAGEPPPALRKRRGGGATPR